MQKTLLRVWPYLWRYRRGVILGVAALLLRNLASTAQPLVIRSGVDSLTDGFRFQLMIGFGAALIVLSALKGVFQYWMRVVLIGISRDIEYDLRNDLFAHLTRLCSGFYSRFRTGDIMARATNDLNSVRMMLGPGLMYCADTVVTAVLAITVMAAVDWRLTLVILLPAPLITLVVIVAGRYIHTRFTKIQAIFSDISSRVQENLSGVRVIRAYVQEEAEKQLFEKLNQDYIAQNLRLARASGLFLPTLHGLVGVSFLLVLWFGGRRLLAGGITLGDFLMFNVFMGYLIWPMIAVGWVVNLMQRGAASLARIDEILTEQPTISDPEKVRPLPSPLRGEIELCDVHLRFPSGEALRGISLVIPAGATVAIVGRTGSGKSTLVQLIPRVFDPTAGAVLLDGIDLRDLPLDPLRRRIGFVPQETFLFSSTLAENIAFGVREATEKQIRRAAEVAGLDGDVAGFPDGYQTLLGERGITLSGGQKQRTAIARAVLRAPRILILDDALSSVDTLTEERILTGLSQTTQDRTTILISHRVSTVRHADRIFVVENGAVAERGTHEELLATGRYYAELYQKQLLEQELEAI
jgi:ATP-binding cassette subfamily B multidrug efflux pump